MAKKKILHVTFDMAIGGTEQVICQLVENTNPNNYETAIACIDNKIGELGLKLQQQGHKVYVLNRKPGFDYRLIAALKKLIDTGGFDILHCHQYTPYIYGVFAALGTKVEVIFTEHGRFYPDSYKWKRFIINPLLTLRTKAIVAISEATKQALIKYENFPKNKVQVIYNGLASSPSANDDTTALRKELELSPSDILLGTVARLDPIKNQHMMISAFAKAAKENSNLKLIIVGDGPIRAELEQHAINEGVKDKVLFTGFIVNPKSYFQLIDIFLLSSLSEGTSMTLLEAMACAKPCIVTDVGGNPEIITNEFNGYITPNRNSDAFYKAVINITNLPGKRVAMGEAARTSFQNKFTVEKMTELYTSLYHECY
ncbi:glycosyltransferase [Dasania sp. GY-MA-18]|uniref:Glycosyltransferase n=1 Tax=Dasania phycosphaerae TaxID=2950436 RepID=A0A9J6RQ42_9GAMM|nr:MULTISPECIES: glycosyltransferase [Dasania]MCR8924118.1 glycosyltransferase [Dasania sp. GY-MA-18]MCZ0866691.1 glycosyltransferase [Dasania phycosphaerae]MCZ0870276.1 glycosyltransferase [Dasania phycosphaerae]